ncbi:undecaprenyl-diphosphate phosphatase [Sinanaerobacter chloroacetimidivorans]|uniref:Undecaprenyl-diphosphatase n=1 Tax=Sinanaerobacter chloroacetimidivorans TaxID=2818044 RepID=A0A8J8B187_9FIRM|nr:undecaprenyl-diphosphate phosphatase [Sinanaerobacter chloroacetimidivorans]MBR0598463.1 undecaprenyl-diphosphate phosphatase [Sinanaerobacter chloroacetimidivorans]
MSVFQAIVYGIVQGITEFLPISSTAHLKLMPWIFGWPDPGNVFDVALHFGTAIAVITFFFKDWIRLVTAGLTKPKTEEGRLFWNLVLATIPGALAGVVLDKYMSVFSNPLLVGILLIIMGIILYLCDKAGKSDIHLEKIGLNRSLLVGIAQVLAIIPGVSRSGITMSVGRAAGIDRESIAKFTFLLSTPIILGDALYHAKDLSGVNIDALPFAAAVLTAAVVGLLSIRFLLNYLRTKSFFIFTVYRFMFGLLVIALSLIR